jgi:serine protease Do
MEDNYNYTDPSHEDEEVTPVENPPVEDATPVEEVATNDTRESDHVLELYQYYRSQPRRVQPKTLVNKFTVVIFIVFMLLCLATFISCINMDLNSTDDYLANLDTIGASGGSTDATNSSNGKSKDTYDYSTNTGIEISQYEPPTRSDSTYINEDGTYTVAGVAKYASDSIIAVYVSTDGITLNGMGSGIVFSDEGYVLTNAHVVEDANYIIGILPDETQVNLSFVGMDTELDVAVLQSDNTDIPVAVMGDSDSVILGEEVVAIGNPAGLTGTVTNGIVSSINRSYTTSDNVERNYIQTDTAISPGNSGGALLNMYGQVVGITTMKISEDETYEGLGFAICINDALECAERLIKNRFRIGITFNLQNDEIEISNIDSTCSVASTNLQVGDVITQIDGQDVYDYSSVMGALEGSKPGDEVTAKVERRSKDGLRSEFYIEFKLMPYGS